MRAQEELCNCVEHLNCQLAEKLASIAEMRCHLDELQSHNVSFEAGQVSEVAVVHGELIKEQAISKNLQDLSGEMH